MDKEKRPMINKINKRILILSPTVKDGLERECTKDDFFSEGDKPIGKGGFGQVWKVRHKATEKIYVIKVMSKQNIIEQKMVEQINREIEIMYLLNHPHIIKLYNHFEDDDNLYLIMHYASKGQLYSLLKKQNRFDQRTTAQFMREIISAVAYLHSFNPPIIHRDIKPENILLDESGRIKLADFGWSNYENKKRTTYCGTPEYLAPEMIKKEGHDTTVDIWDLGVLMFELLTGRPPFSGSNQNELFMNIKKHKIQWPDDFPPLAKNLISKILKQNPKERITLEEILAHAWFEKNPPLKPVLQNQVLEKKELLELHLINVKPENIKEEINSVIEKEKIVVSLKRQSIVDTTKKPLTNNFTGNEAVLAPSPPDTHKNNNINDEMREIIEKLKKESNENKLRGDKLELENKTFKNEILKLKESLLNKPQSEVELQKLRDELDKYKIMNKDRLDLLAEIEEKNNEIMEIKNKMRTLENELETTKRNCKQIQIKLEESINLNESNESKIKDLKDQLETISKEKDEISTQYQKKLELMQVKFLDTDKENAETQTQNTNRLLEMIHETIKESQIAFKNKSDNLNKTITDMKEDSFKCEKKLLEIINEKQAIIQDVIGKVKSSLEDDFLKIKSKLEKDNSYVSNERLEWQKKQIAELMPYKIKSSNLENQIEKLEKQTKECEKIIEAHKNRVEIIEKVNNELLEKIKKLEKNKINLEHKLCDVKDYIFRHHQDKLDEFKKFDLF